MFRKSVLHLMVALLAVMPLLGVFARDTHAASSRVAVIKEMKGTVKVKKAGGSKEFTAFARMSLNEGDILEVGSNGSAVLQFSNGTSEDDKMTVAANSKLTFSKLSNKSGTTTKVSMFKGSAWVDVKSIANKDDEFTLETPTAIMGVRGTHLFVGVDPVTGFVKLMVAAGVVETRTRDDNNPDIKFVYPTQNAVVTDNDSGEKEISIATVDLEWLIQKNGSMSEIMRAILASAQAIEEENRRYVEEYREKGLPAPLGDSVEDLQRFKNNTENLLGALIDQAVNKNLMSKDELDRIIEETGKATGFELDLSKKNLDLTNEEKRLQEKLRELENQKRKQAEDDARRKAEERKNELTKKIEEQRKQLEEANKKAAEEAKRKAKEEYERKLAEAERARYEEDKKKLEQGAEASASPSPSTVPGGGSNPGSSQSPSPSQTPKSSNANLSGLALSNGTLNFNPNTLSYTVSVPDVGSITVKATAADAGKASLKVNGAAATSGVPITIQLNPAGSSTTATISVTAEDGVTSKTYSVVVQRTTSASTTMNDIGITFNPNQTSYVGSPVPSNTTNLQMTFGSGSGNETVGVTVNGIYLNSYAGGDSFGVPLEEYNNEIEITITPNGGQLAFYPGLIASLDLSALQLSAVSTGSVYKFQVWRQPVGENTGDSVLRGIALFSDSPGQTVKTQANLQENVWKAGFPVDVTSAYLKFYLTDAGDRIRIGQQVYGYGDAVPLTVSNPVIGVNVSYTIENSAGSPKGSGTVIVSKAPSTVARLSTLMVDGTVVEDFAADRFNYSINVPFATSGITVTAEPADDATYTVSGGQALEVGNNTVTVKVTAEDGIAKQNYTITVNRAAASDNADLSGLTLSQGDLTFIPGKTAFTVSVVNTVTSVNVSPTTADQTATLTVNGANVTSGSGKNVTLPVGTTEITIIVTAQNGATKTYTITVNRAASSDASLSQVIVNEETLTADGQGNYTLSVDYSTASATVSAIATKAPEGATVSVNPSQQISLSVGSNSVTIVVTAPNGTEKSYSLTIVREASSDASLSQVIVNEETLTADGQGNYTLSVGYSTASATVSALATKAPEGATVSVNPSQQISLSVGSNNVTIVVTAPNGTTKKTYTLTVNRAASSDASLSQVIVNEETLTADGQGNYTLSVGYSTASATVSALATKAPEGATVSVNPSQQINLSVGSNNVTIVVTAPNGTTKKTYTITVNRAASSDASLSQVIVNEETLTADGQGNYTLSVGYSTASATVSAIATKAPEGATVSVNPSQQISLSVGSNSVTIVVTAPNGTEKSYSLTIVREASSDASLSQVIVNEETLTADGQGNYTLSVGYSTASATVSALATKAPEGATVSVNPSQQISLSVGSNNVTIVVTAPNGTTKKTYTLTVNRAASNDASLSQVIVNEETLTADGQGNYTLSVGYSTASATVSAIATKAPEGATVSVNPSQQINLSVGSNNVTIVVTAPNGTTKKTYTLTVNRAASSDASLSQVIVNEETLTADGQGNYTLSVGYSTASATVSALATKAPEGATVSVNPSQQINLSVGSNNVTIVVTAPNGTTKKTYTLTVNRAASSDASLSQVIVNEETLTADGQGNYTLSVGYSTASATVSAIATKAPEGATVSVNPSQQISLSVGSNSVTIVVTAPNGTEKSYSLTIVREASSDASLSQVIVNEETLTADGQGNYTLSVGYSTASATVSALATKAPEGATVSVNPSQQISLSVGSNNVTIVVTAPNGTTKKTYTLTVNRAASNDASLSQVIVNEETLTADGQGNYTLSVGYSTASATVSAIATKAPEGATVSVNPSQQISLSVGSNNVTIVVTAPNGTTKKTYTLTVNREASSDASLSQVIVNEETLTADGQGNYTLSVDYSTASATVSAIATKAPEGATVSVNPSQQISLSVGSNNVTIVITAPNGTEKSYSLTIVRAASNDASLSQVIVNEETLTADGQGNYTLSVGYSTASATVSALATKAPEGATVSVNPSQQISLSVGSNSVTIVVTAPNGTEKSYSLTIVREASSDASLSQVIVNEETLTADGQGNYTLSVGYSTASATVSALATKAPEGATVSVNPSQQISLSVGSNNVTIVVTAPNGTTKKTYTLTVNREASSDASLSQVIVNEETLTADGQGNYTLSVGYSTASATVSALATKAPEGATVSVNPSQQISLSVGSNVVTIVVTAPNGTEKSYSLTIVRAANTAKEITLFKFAGLTPPAVGEISGESISLNVPYGTNVTHLVATFAISAQSTVKIGETVQLSGETANDFSQPLTYTVVAQDGSTKSYTVTVTILPNTAKEITLFKFAGLTPPAMGEISGENISLNVPYGTNVTHLVATFASSAQSTVKIGETVQLSGETANNFSQPLTYTVVAQDGSTKNYTVTVTILPNTAKEITLFKFAGLTPPAMGEISGENISLNVPYGTNVTHLVATFASSVQSTVKIGETVQLSGETANNFSQPLTYTVVAQDGSTKNYTVTVNVALPATTANLSSLILTSNGETYPFEQLAGGTGDWLETIGLPLRSDMVYVALATEDANATVEVIVNGGSESVDGGTNEFYFWRSVAETNTVEIIVTAEDGVTRKTYTIRIEPEPVEDELLVIVEPKSGGQSQSYLFYGDSWHADYSGEYFAEYIVKVKRPEGTSVRMTINEIEYEPQNNAETGFDEYTVQLGAYSEQVILELSEVDSEVFVPYRLFMHGPELPPGVANIQVSIDGYDLDVVPTFEGNWAAQYEWMPQEASLNLKMNWNELADIASAQVIVNEQSEALNFESGESWDANLSLGSGDGLHPGVNKLEIRLFQAGESGEPYVSFVLWVILGSNYQEYIPFDIMSGTENVYYDFNYADSTLTSYVSFWENGVEVMNREQSSFNVVSVYDVHAKAYLPDLDGLFSLGLSGDEIFGDRTFIIVVRDVSGSESRSYKYTITRSFAPGVMSLNATSGGTEIDLYRWQFIQAEYQYYGTEFTYATTVESADDGITFNATFRSNVARVEFYESRHHEVPSGTWDRGENDFISITNLAAPLSTSSPYSQPYFRIYEEGSEGEGEFAGIAVGGSEKIHTLRMIVIAGDKVADATPIDNIVVYSSQSTDDVYLSKVDDYTYTVVVDEPDTELLLYATMSEDEYTPIAYSNSADDEENRLNMEMGMMRINVNLLASGWNEIIIRTFDPIDSMIGEHDTRVSIWKPEVPGSLPESLMLDTDSLAITYEGDVSAGNIVGELLEPKSMHIGTSTSNLYLQASTLESGSEIESVSQVLENGSETSINRVGNVFGPFENEPGSRLKVVVKESAAKGGHRYVHELWRVDDIPALTAVTMHYTAGSGSTPIEVVNEMIVNISSDSMPPGQQSYLPLAFQLEASGNHSVSFYRVVNGEDMQTEYQNGLYPIVFNGSDADYKIVVTSGSGSHTYLLKLRLQKSTDSSIHSMQIGYEFAVDAGANNYVYLIAASATHLYDLDIQTHRAAAVDVKLNDSDTGVTSEQGRYSFALNMNGPNVITINVTAEDGSSSTTYQLELVRDNTPDNLVLDGFVVTANGEDIATNAGYYSPMIKMYTYSLNGNGGISKDTNTITVRPVYGVNAESVVTEVGTNNSTQIASVDDAYIINQLNFGWNIIYFNLYEPNKKYSRVNKLDLWRGGDFEIWSGDDQLIATVSYNTSYPNNVTVNIPVGVTSIRVKPKLNAEYARLNSSEAGQNEQGDWPYILNLPEFSDEQMSAPFEWDGSSKTLRLLISQSGGAVSAQTMIFTIHFVSEQAVA